MEEIYCQVCENCIKQCNFSLYNLEKSITKGNNVNGEIITWKCTEFDPIFVSNRGDSCHQNDIFFK